MNSEEGEIILNEWNARYFLQALPAAIFLILTITVGSVGNILILYVYWTKMKSSAIRCFILSLSFLDLTICLVDIPLEIHELRSVFTFGKDIGLCKAFHLIHDFLFIAAMYLLIAIAVERFKSVCFPFKKQMSILTARVVIVVCFALAFFFAIPAGFKYGRKTMPIAGEKVNGTLCSTADGHDQDLVLFNYIFWILQNICGFTILITLYFLIWFKVYRHTTKQQNMSFQSSNMSGSIHTIGQNVESTTAQTNRISAAGASKRHKGVQNLTAVMFTITATSFLAYTPIMCKMLIMLISEDAIKNFKDSVPWFYKLFVRTYYIPCAANPIIYGLCNPTFRHKLKDFIRKRVTACRRQ